jgi:hypothetical protein
MFSASICPSWQTERGTIRLDRERLDPVRAKGWRNETPPQIMIGSVIELLRQPLRVGSFPFRGDARKVRYRRISPSAVWSGESPLTEPTAAAQSRKREPLFLAPERPFPLEFGNGSGGGKAIFAMLAASDG